MDERDDAERVIRVMAEFYDPAHNEYAIPVTQRVMRRLAAEFGYVDNNEARRMRGEIESLQAENAKMRELMSDMWSVMSDWYAANAMEDSCRHHLGCNMDELEARVRHMGIEVG